MRRLGDIATPLMWTGTWIEIHFVADSPTGKTYVWEVTNDGIVLGQIRWFGRWRKYAFFPQRDTVFEEVCLRDLAMFCSARTADHRDLARLAREARHTATGDSAPPKENS